MKKHLFSIVEMIVVISIICILIAMAFPYINEARIKQKKTVTRNMLNQHKAMISAYYSDYGLLPLSMHRNPDLFSDGTPVEYWKRAPKGLFTVNSIPSGTIKNADLRFDLYDNEGGSVSTSGEFDAKYPSKNLIIPLDPWYTGAANKSKLEMEEMVNIAHSSRFLNYYLSYSGFDLVKDSSYVKNESKWLGDYDTTFRLSAERSALVRPFLYFLTDETILWNGATPVEAKLTTIPPYTSYVLDKTKIYFDYVPKIIGTFNSQSYSKNLAEDKKRRLYDFREDKNPDGSNKSLPILKDKYSPKRVTLQSDRVMFNGNFFGSNSLRDARDQKNAALASVAAAAAQLAAAVTPAQIAAANLAVTNAANADAAADKALKEATKGDVNNSNSFVYMKAHTDNVKCIVDAFNTPIVYITYLNQRKEAAKTYTFVDPSTGVPDPKQDKSMRANSFILYSLGPNKADDSDLGEKYMEKLGTGDDIIEMAGEK